MSNSRPRLCFVAPMVAVRGGRVVSQSETLAELFASDGYVVRTTSSVVNRPLRLVDMMASLARWRNEFDIVIVSAFSGAGFVVADMAVRVARTLGKPVVVCLRGGNLPRFATRHPRWVGSVVTRASAVVAPSGYLAEALRRWVHVRVIPNVINLEEYPFRIRGDANPTMLWMRSFEPLYNAEMAIRAMAAIVSDVPHARLTLAGQPGESLATCRALARELGLDDAVSFVGFLSGDRKMAQFADNDIYLHTNRVDNMPVSVVEAAASGMAIVATRVGGIPFLLEDGENALLVDSDDPSQLAAAVLRLLRDPALCARLSSGARRIGERSSWAAVKGEWESVLSEVYGAESAVQKMAHNGSS